MQLNTDTQKLFHELDYRENDGIEVSLLWNQSDNTLSVYVCDTRSNESFELAAHPKNGATSLPTPTRTSRRDR
jgi:hypothetical protein